MSEDIKNLIDATIGNVFNLKAFIESVVSNIGEPNDVETLQEIHQKAEHYEKEIEENIKRLSRLTIKSTILSPKKILLNNQERVPKKIKKSARLFDSFFKYYMHIYDLSESHSTKESDFKRFLDELKINVCRKKNMKGIQHFEYQRDEKKNSYQLKVKFLFGIKLIIFSEDGSIKNYLFILKQESLNLKQLLSMFEVKFEYDMSTKNRSVKACLNAAAEWINRHRGIYTEKCKICDMHLNFKQGVPLIPLITYTKGYYHIDCYFDMKNSVH